MNVKACEQCGMQFHGESDARRCLDCREKEQARTQAVEAQLAERRASETLQRAIARRAQRERFASTQNAAALELIADGKLSEALRVLNEALKVSPEHKSSLANRADLLDRLGMHAQAEADRAHLRSDGLRRATEDDLAGFWQRFGANFLDGIIAVALAAVPAVLLGLVAYESTLPNGPFVTQTEEQEAEDVALGVGYVACLAVGFVYLWIGNSLGGTWGKRALGLRVVSADNGGTIGVGSGLARVLIWYLGAIPLYLGWLWMLWDEGGQTWHDKAASSVVVRSS